MTRLTDLDLDNLDALEKAATAGPWKVITGDDVIYGIAIRTHDGSHIAEWDDLPFDIEDAELIAAARNALAPMLAELRQLREVARAARDAYPDNLWEHACNEIDKRFANAMRAYFAPADKEPPQ